MVKARQERGAVAVFGKGWGGELRLPQRKGVGSYFVDWVLARLDGCGELTELTAIEVQTIDTTGSYGNARKSLAEERKMTADTVGLNWENVSKRINPANHIQGTSVAEGGFVSLRFVFRLSPSGISPCVGKAGRKRKVARVSEPARIRTFCLL